MKTTRYSTRKRLEKTYGDDGIINESLSKINDRDYDIKEDNLSQDKRIKFGSEIKKQLFLEYSKNKINVICPCCRSRKFLYTDSYDWHISHKISLDKGGNNEFENLIPLCHRCNLDMGTKSFESYKLFYSETIEEFRYGSSSIPTGIKGVVTKNSKISCSSCKRKLPFSLTAVPNPKITVSNGHVPTIKNIICICENCNKSKKYLIIQSNAVNAVTHDNTVNIKNDIPIKSKYHWNKFLILTAFLIFVSIIINMRIK